MAVARLLNDRLEKATSLTVVVGMSLLAVFGMVFAIARATESITAEAAALHDADEALRSATVVRAQLALATHAGLVDTEFGTDSTELIEVAQAESSEALEEFEAGMGELLGWRAFGSLPGSAMAFSNAADEAIEALADREFSKASELEAGALEATYSEVVASLVSVRDDLRTGVDGSDRLLGMLGTVAGFLVAVLIPAAVILLYRALVRRQARQAMLESRLEAEQSLSSAREEFIANASHELRTPLTSISGLAMVLEEDPSISTDPTLAEMVGLIVGEAADLRRMVEDMLTTARLDVGALSFQFEDIEAERILSEVVESMRAISADVDVTCEGASVRGDSTRLRQILRNLLSNAHKYGGPNVSVRGRVEDRTYVWDVIDDGDGVPEGIEDELFERFVHRGKDTSTRGSVGLGLSIVRSLADAMGGHVTYRRENGLTAFSIRMPLSETAGSVVNGVDGVLISS